MRRLVAVLALALAGSLAGCGSTGAAGDPPAPTTPAAPATRPVHLVRTGGIAGVAETIGVEPDGSWRHAGPGGVRTGRLTPAQHDRLARLAADPDLAAEATRTPGSAPCADGYELNLTVGATSVRWFECGPGRAGPPAATQIARLLDASTK